MKPTTRIRRYDRLVGPDRIVVGITEDGRDRAFDLLPEPAVRYPGFLNETGNASIRVELDSGRMER
jgi:hypothetical protein